jgi:hypothetical protein
MRLTVATLAGLVALAAVSVQAAPLRPGEGPARPNSTPARPLAWELPSQLVVTSPILAQPGRFSDAAWPTLPRKAETAH